MSNATYNLQNNKVYVLHDGDDNTLPFDREIDAMVASGDCFVTLATNVDQVADIVGANEAVVHPQLNKIAAMLLYLQRHYVITRKAADYRQ